MGRCRRSTDSCRESYCNAPIRSLMNDGVSVLTKRAMGKRAEGSFSESIDSQSKRAHNLSKCQQACAQCVCDNESCD